MPEVFIGAGSNADPERRLRLALAELERRFGALRCSSVYRGAAVGEPAADYLNLVVGFADGARRRLGARAVAGDRGARRPRSRDDAAVCELDLDLLLYGRRVDAERRLPRPGLFSLPFVLVPLAELAPELAHPVTGDAAARVARDAARGSLARVGALRLPADAAAAVDGDDLARDVRRIANEEQHGRRDVLGLAAALERRLLDDAGAQRVRHSLVGPQDRARRNAVHANAGPRSFASERVSIASPALAGAVDRDGRAAAAANARRRC